MKNCIITPTYAGHFKFIEKYLASFNYYVVDKQDIMIAFILSSREEADLFGKIIGKYKNVLLVSVYVFDDIMKQYGVRETSDSVLKKYGGTSYQMMKKLYSMLAIDADRYFILDSESCWIRPTNMTELFDRFFNNPFVVVSDFKTRKADSDFIKDHFDATNYILGHCLPKMPFEHFMWFYSKKMIQMICTTYGSPYEMVVKVHDWELQTKGHSVGLMETMLVLNYAYEHKDELNYRVVEAEKELVNYLGTQKANEYINRFFELTLGKYLGIIEFPCMMLTKENCSQMSQLFRDNGIFVTRCDSASIAEYHLEKRFLKDGGINILAVSQDHVFLPGLSGSRRFARIMKDTMKAMKARMVKRV